MHPARALVRLENVDVDIGGGGVLHKICLQITAGRHLGVVGNNGSGKSTLLALIAGLRWPAPRRGSRIYDFGNGPERDAVTARERIALVGHELQDLYVARGWNFRARDIVHSGITRTEIPQRRARPATEREALELLESMDLSHLADRRLFELSRGEQRRVLITRSLAFEPAALLLDEPASGLDTGSRAALDTMLTRAAEKTQIVIAAHRPDELPDFITDIATLVSGRLQGHDARPEPKGHHTRPEPKGHDARPEPKGHHTRPEPIGNGDGVQRETVLSSSASAAGSADRDRGTDSVGDRIMIELEGTSVWLGEREVLKSLDWKLKSGEHWMVTGPNGTGKSTFLRLLHGEIRPARGGSIRWPGLDDPADVWTLRRQVALVSPELQARYRYPSTVFEAVASGYHSSIGLVQRLTPEQRDSVTALLETFGLTSLSDRLLSSLSYGQRHRALIARCLMTNPKIVLLDEPWEGLDAPTREIVTDELGRRMADGTQIVCVSHIGPAGLKFNRSLSLEDGVIVSDDDSGEPGENSASEPSQAAGYRPR